MSEIKWIKLSVNMFDDEKIKLIRTMPEGDSIALIWIQILCHAGKINDGGLVYMGQNLAYSPEMLSTIFDHPLNTIRLALDTLQQFGMIDVDDSGTIDVLNWEKHQSTDKMARIQNQNSVRQQRYYYRNKLRKLGVDVDAEGFTDDLDELKEMSEELEKPNVSMTLPNDTEVRSKKLEVRSKKLEVRSKKLEVRSKKLEDSPAKAEPPIPYDEIVDYLNKKAGKQFKQTTKKTQSLIKARFNEGFEVDDFKKVIDVKTEEWLNDNKMSQYLRPETLFGTKFESYLNQPLKEKQEYKYGSGTEPEEVMDDRELARIKAKMERYNAGNQ